MLVFINYYNYESRESGVRSLVIGEGLWSDRS